MTDLTERELERAAATGFCAVAEAALTRARERRGDRPHDHPQPWWQALTPLEALKDGHSGWLVRLRYGLQRLPRGAREATEEGVRRTQRVLLTRARRIQLTPGAQVLPALESQLNEANGRRRERTIDMDELLADIGNAANRAELDPVLTSYDVANAYGYQATTTTTTCVRIGQRVLVWVGTGSASRGTRHTPWHGGGGQNEGTRICHAALGRWPTVISRARARKLGAEGVGT